MAETKIVAFQSVPKKKKVVNVEKVDKAVNVW